MTSDALLFVLQPTRGDRFGLSQASTEQRRVRARDGEDVLGIWSKGAPSRAVGNREVKPAVTGALVDKRRTTRGQQSPGGWQE